MREQLEPEPVGYFYNGRFSTEKNAPGIGIYGVPVYTAPPKREWVGMTNEEMQGFGNDLLSPHKSIRDVFNSIEAKLREKNG